MKLEDITVERVKEAYAKTGKQPCRKTFGKDGYACPFSVLTGDDGRGKNNLPIEAWQFIYGVDGLSGAIADINSPWYQRGKEIAAAIFGDES